MPLRHKFPLQQPPLQRAVAEQLGEHMPLWQAWYCGQSVTVEQPHVPPMHACPAGLAEQSTHPAPTGPQAVPAVPGRQRLLASQHPLHAAPTQLGPH